MREDEIDYSDEESICDEIEVICSSCGAHFFILGWQHEADLEFEESPEHICPECAELPF